MTKEVLFPMFSEWKSIHNRQAKWQDFVKALNEVGIQNPWKETFNINEVNKKLGLSYVDEEGWTISKSRIANGKIISFKLKEIYNNEEEIKKQENKDE